MHAPTHDTQKNTHTHTHTWMYTNIHRRTVPEKDECAVAHMKTR